MGKFMVSTFGRGKGREGDCCSLLMFRLSRLSVCFPQRDRVLSMATRWPATVWPHGLFVLPFFTPREIGLAPPTSPPQRPLILVIFQHPKDGQPISEPLFSAFSAAICLGTIWYGRISAISCFGCPDKREEART